MNLKTPSRKTLEIPLVIVLFLLAQVPFALAGQWQALGTAPDATGEYNVVVRAKYLETNQVATHPLLLWVASLAPFPQGLQIQPLFQRDIIPPISLKYQITLDEEPVTELHDSNVTIEFTAPGGDKIYSVAPPLSHDGGGQFSTQAAVPFEGDYNALIDLSVRKEDTIYRGSFTSEFYSDSPSTELDMNTFVRESVYEPGEVIPIYANMSFQGKELGGINIFKASILDDSTDLIWHSGKHIYEGSLEAPLEEGIYELTIFAVRQGYIDKKRIYVVDTSLLQGRQCPITPSDSSCNQVEELRRCVDEYKQAITFVSEEQLTHCAETAFAVLRKRIICEDRKGDLDGDLRLDLDDAELFQETILSLTQQKRQEYVDCADYDNDEDVDEDDLKCLVRVLAGRNFGDMKGGYCFDVAVYSPLAGDLDGNRRIDADDNAIIEKIKAVAAKGVAIPTAFLRMTDFDQDGDIDTADQDCLKTFVGMRLDLDEPALPLPKVDIPPSCMEIYDLDGCLGIPGDINGDLFIDETDEILVMLTSSRKIQSGSGPGQTRMACADVNQDDRITREDELCVKAYVDGDFQRYFICRGCTELIPPAYRAAVEICGDGWDNDCDGLTDRTSENFEEDECICSEKTDCWRVQDGDGGTVPGVGDGQVQLCRDLGWDPIGYRWVSLDEINCNAGLNCQWIACEGTQYKCSYDGGAQPKWYLPDDLPPEDDDANAQPRRCEDGWDNDCIGGDERCDDAEEEGEWYQQVLAGVIMFVVAAAATWAAGPLIGGIAMMGLGLIASQVFPEYKWGIMIGGILGGLAGSWAHSSLGDMASAIDRWGQGGSFLKPETAAAAAAGGPGGTGGGANPEGATAHSSIDLETTATSPTSTTSGAGTDMAGPIGRFGAADGTRPPLDQLVSGAPASGSSLDAAAGGAAAYSPEAASASGMPAYA